MIAIAPAPAVSPSIDADTFRSLPKAVASPDDAPECPSCGRRMRAITTCQLFTRYYPVHCHCTGVNGIKRRRRIDWSRVDWVTRVRLGVG
ncbi:hypothetical protein [Allorhodopirellula heiligendammensis]|uniref:Uncharacterized protein n=1 Tax=Allorhodopirellula heiligendammensis TaxID=2714739 RepID=A0A5C6C5D2_9BACT|nr:hypothetical protein [Allorhodopirellula heiligendammensis]TWU18009.1 hypothetical protein Poly21_01620 [Allorhodopirellula heiligendammensis]